MRFKYYFPAFQRFQVNLEQHLPQTFARIASLTDISTENAIADRSQPVVIRVMTVAINLMGHYIVGAAATGKTKTQLAYVTVWSYLSSVWRQKAANHLLAKYLYFIYGQTY